MNYGFAIYNPSGQLMFNGDSLDRYFGVIFDSFSTPCNVSITKTYTELVGVHASAIYFFYTTTGPQSHKLEYSNGVLVLTSLSGATADPAYIVVML